MKKTLRIRMEADIEIENKPDKFLDFSVDVVEALRPVVKRLIEGVVESKTDSPIKISVDWTCGTPES